MAVHPDETTSRSKIREIYPYRTLAAMPHQELLIKREPDGRIWPSLTFVLAIQNDRRSPHHGNAGHSQPGAPHEVSGLGFLLLWEALLVCLAVAKNGSFMINLT
jgi:hypothetical protein